MCFNNVNSDMEEIVYGVPQGSILGPMLFTLFINDIVNSSPLLYLILFADDTNLLLSGDNYNDLTVVLNHQLLLLSEWFQSNKLTLNVAKTNYMLFGSKPKRTLANSLKIVIDGKPISHVTEVKFLGIMIDENLNWKSHASLVSSKIAKSLGTINRIKHVLNRSALKTLYYSLIYSHLIYCILLWGNSSVKALNNVELLQKRAFRMISGSYYRAPTNPMCCSLRLLKLRDIYKREVVTFMYKFGHNLLPTCCDHLIERASDQHYALRSPDEFVLEFATSKVRLNFISYIGPRLWKQTPSNLRSSPSFSVLKTRYLDYLLCNYI